MDDIMVKSKKREENFYVLKKVFERCRTFKLRITLSSAPLECPLGNSWVS